MTDTVTSTTEAQRLIDRLTAAGITLPYEARAALAEAYGPFLDGLLTLRDRSFYSPQDRWDYLVRSFRATHPSIFSAESMSGYQPLVTPHLEAAWNEALAGRYPVGTRVYTTEQVVGVEPMIGGTVTSTLYGVLPSIRVTFDGGYGEVQVNPWHIAKHTPDVPLIGEPLPVGTRLRLLPDAKTYRDGGVYFGGVTEVEVIAYYTSDTQPDVRVKRLDGGGPEDQTVGRQYLRRIEVDVVPGTTEFPQAPSDIRVNHGADVTRIREWADNDERDVKAGVDEQMRFFGDLGIWPTDSCGTSGEAKDWVSAVMRYKAERLGIAFPVVAEPEPVTYSEAAYESLKSERDRLQRWQQQAIADMEKASQRLISEADRRNWCSEYDEIVDAINGDLGVLAFEERRKEIEVTISGYVRVPFTYSVTVEVSDEDDAESDAIDQFTSNVSASDVMRYHTDAYSAEFEDDLEAERD